MGLGPVGILRKSWVWMPNNAGFLSDRAERVMSWGCDVLLDSGRRSSALWECRDASA